MAHHTVPSVLMGPARHRADACFLLTALMDVCAGGVSRLLPRALQQNPAVCRLVCSKVKAPARSTKNAV